MAAPMSVVDGLPFAEDKKKYIVEVLDPVLEEMVSEVLTEMPAVPLDFMINWLRKRSGVVASGQMSVLQRNHMLKQELKRVTTSIEEAGHAIRGAEEGKDDKDDEDEDDEEDDDCESLPDDYKKPEAQMKGPRHSVSAEAYGTWNEKKAFTAPVHPKSDEQKERLKQTLLKSFMFSDLEEKDMETVILAMKEMNFEAGQKVISEGESGEYLFVVESGKLDCSKVIDGAEKVVRTCEPGDVFGELALLYNCPRAASVTAREDCVCWELDRESFNNIVKDSAVQRRTRHDDFLKSVALISSLDDYERSQIADALVSEAFAKGDVIITQDEPGDKFYIIEEGLLYATKSAANGEPEKVMDYNPGDYFGELALLKNQPRAATITVSSDRAKVLSMSRAAFVKMLGPLQEILARHVTSYK